MIAVFAWLSALSFRLSAGLFWLKADG